MSAILARLFSDLDIAVLERAKDGTFSMLSGTPPWLKNLWPATESSSEGLNPGDVFYFLEDFLDRNEDFWRAPTNDRRASGVWTENTPDGKEQLLEATAIYIEDTPLLLIRIPHHQQVWPIFQQAREQRLEYEQLIDEINKREVLLHCIVHDLSNPLASIKGSLNLLQSEDMVESDGDELLSIGLRQAAKMQNLIRSILTTFANEVRPLVPTLIGTDIAPDLRSCAQEVVKSLQATASLKGIQVQLTDTTATSPFKVVGEAERLERVLYNLLANAIRHSANGQTVSVDVFDDGEFIHANVTDQGAGVPEDLIEGLFDRFSQGKDKTGQVGLGLYFCKITIEGWGGTIGYAHGESGGARFWFRLPKPVEHEDTTPEIQHT
ncbi:MAG: HAMP domain-containing sensor histidine kinase [Bacteroidota bacterium]